MRLHTYIIGFALFFISCKKEAKVASGQLDNYYFVKVGDVALPVRVCGNINSDIAIVFNHGGPGGSAQGERAYAYWKEIEKYYKVVYWDQRGSGLTQGNTDPNTITIEQFSEDLDNIVDFTKQVVKADKIFIHGISWGGGLTTYYLLDTLHQKKVKGAIVEAPAYDLKHGIMQLSVNWLLQRADSMLALHVNDAYWQNVKDIYAAYPAITNVHMFQQHLSFLGQVNGIVYNTSNLAAQSISLPKYESFVGSYNSMFTINHLSYNQASLFEMDLTDQLYKIKVPLLLIWGRKDGLLPFDNLAQKYADNYGGSDIKFEPYRYDVSAHLPHAEQYQEFQIDALKFIELHK